MTAHMHIFYDTQFIYLAHFKHRLFNFVIYL